MGSGGVRGAVEVVVVGRCGRKGPQELCSQLCYWGSKCESFFLFVKNINKSAEIGRVILNMHGPDPERQQFAFSLWVNGL